MASDTGLPGAGAAPPVSLSRYRSKRQSQRTQPEPVADDSPTTPTTPAIPSRYRHRSASLTRRQDDSPLEQTETLPPVPPLPLGPSSTHIPVTRSADPLLPSPPSKTDFAVNERIVEEPDAMARPRTRDSGKSFRAPDRRMAPGTRWVDAPTSFGGSQPDLRSSKPKKSPMFSLFSRSRRGTVEDEGVSLPPPTGVPSPPDSRGGAPTPKFIEAGGKGIVPQVDAPASASNAGDRRVVVRCMNSSVTLPVKTDTTPTDILHSAANLITHKIKPETSLVLESYLQYGLERRLRRYERVRDVMNSWDRDALNALVVIPSDMPENDRDLALAHAPRTQDSPFSFSLQLHHGPRVGKWSKRFITLTREGQMFAAKKAGVRAGDKDAVSLCHLSDFDIYSPTEHQMRKVLKPPKKLCYAIKSQQKSSVFTTGENFVHFFCTDDAKAAKLFHEQVHGWRSWYLVNRKTDVQDLHATAQGGPPSRHVSTKSARGGHRSRRSVDVTPYAIGSFKPLIDADAFTKPFGEAASEEPRPWTQRRVEEPQRRTSQQTQEPHRRGTARQSQEAQKGPPAEQGSASRSRLSKSSSQHGRAMPPPSGEANFGANGLLGAKYEERKEEQRRREETLRRLASEENPFTEGPSLLNSLPAHDSPARDGLERKASRYRRDRRATSPTSSIRRPDMPAPLVDFEDPAADPMSWRQEIARNRGHAVRAPDGVPLVDLATGRSAARFDSAGGRPTTSRTAHRFDPATGTFTSREPAEEEFAAETLVGKVARSQSTASRVGRSVSTRSRGGRHGEAPPLPADGTLLARYEAQKSGRSGSVR